MPDYQNGKIYKIWSPEGDDIYIGSTTEILCRRLAAHKSTYNAGKNVTSRILFEKYNDVRIELVEEFSCDKKSKLIAREGHYIRTLDCVNKIIPDRTDKEYYETNKVRILEKRKEYRETNKEYLEKNKEYYEKNKDFITQKIKCECGCEIRRAELARHKRTKKHIKLMENI